MNTTFGTEFRSARAKHDKSQGDIARALGVERSYITKVESGAIGTPSREHVINMIDALEVTDPVERINLLLVAGHVNKEMSHLGQNMSKYRVKTLWRDIGICPKYFVPAHYQTMD